MYVYIAKPKIHTFKNMEAIGISAKSSIYWETETQIPASHNSEGVVEFEVLTAVVMKSTAIFWDITPCSPLKVN
jgi:hypothetical protein